MTYSIGNGESSTLEPMVRKLEFWQKFTADDRRALLTLPHRIKNLRQHHYVVRELDQTKWSSTLLSGFAARSKIVGGGRRQILAIHMKGDLVDLQNSLLVQADHSVQMLTAGTVAMISRQEIVRIAFERPAIGKALWIDTLVEASIAHEWIANVGRRDARSRVAHLLCELALRMKVAGLGEKDNFELPMTQEHLGDTVGLTPVHINRTMRALETEGLIERRNARTIMIGNWKNLADVGDFSNAYLHLVFDRTQFVMEGPPDRLFNSVASDLTRPTAMM